MNLKTDLVSNQLDSCYLDLYTLFTETIIVPHQHESPETIDLRKVAIHELVNQVFHQKHTKKQLMLLRLLTRLVNNRVVEVRFVCEYMLNNLVFSNNSNSNANYLTILNSSTSYINTTNAAANPPNSTNSANPTNNLSLIQKLVQSHNAPAQNTTTTSASTLATTEFKATPTYLWCKVLECVRRFIPLHDYKSCRDIFKMLLEVVKRIPHSHSSYPAQLETELLYIKSQTWVIQYKSNELITICVSITFFQSNALN